MCDRISSSPSLLLAEYLIADADHKTVQCAVPNYHYVYNTRWSIYASQPCTDTMVFIINWYVARAFLSQRELQCIEIICLVSQILNSPLLVQWAILANNLLINLCCCVCGRWIFTNPVTYSVYYSSCLSWAVSHLYHTADDVNPPTCIVHGINYVTAYVKCL